MQEKQDAETGEQNRMDRVVGKDFAAFRESNREFCVHIEQIFGNISRRLDAMIEECANLERLYPLNKAAPRDH